MGRSRRVEQATQTVGNSLVASAARVGNGKGALNFSQIAKQGRGWQTIAWEMYHQVGEYRYSCDWVGSMISKAILFPTLETNGKIERILTGPVFNYVDRLFGNTDGKTEMLRLIGIHMTVAGECFIMGYEDPDSEIGAEIWQVVSATRLRNVGTDDDPVWMINGQELHAEDHKAVLVVRIWRPDPDDHLAAISPSRAVLSVLGEIVKLTQHIDAQVNSRLAGAGILLMPSEMTFPPPPETVDKEGKPVHRQANNALDLMELIQQAMATAIEDRSDPSALVPIVITAPGEVIDKIKHLTFWSGLDEQAVELRNEAIRRLGLGMDMPPEVLQGLSETNHWSAWQSDESAIKSHTEPLLKIITSALADGYLRPLLLSDQSAEITGYIEQYSIGADTAEMRQRPNRSKEALELHQMGLLSDEALLRETGFDPDNDGMDKTAQQTWFLRKMASGSTTPDQVEAAMRILFEIDLPAERSGAEAGDEARPAPSLQEHPTRDIPDREKGERRREHRENGDVPSATVPHALVHNATVASIAAASDQIVLRALERAGNKLKSNMQGVKPAFAAVDLYKTVEIPADQIEFLLADAWAHVPRIAERYGMDPAKLTAELDNYTSELLRTRTEHSYDALVSRLAFPLEGAYA